MIERRMGHIINVGSLGSLIGLPSTTAYSASKFGVAGLSEALWGEVLRFNIAVTLVCPHAMKTNMLSNTKSYSPAKEGADEYWAKVIEKAMNPDIAAQSILKAAEKKRFMVLLGKESFIMYNMKRICPNTFMKIMAKIISRITD